jgi:hypothetical protein
MDKIIEALSRLLPQDQLSEVAVAIKAELEEAKSGMEKEYGSKLEEAYAQLSEELKKSEATAYEGYEQAKAIIIDLRNRLEMQQKESKAAMDEGYEEAYQMLLAEKAKNENLEVEMYEQFNGKLKEMKDYMVNKVHQFLEFKGQEIYEQARREILNDPRMVEYKVTLDRIIENVTDYLSEEDYNSACSRKLEEAAKQIEGIQRDMKILEARNIRLSTDNSKLNETVRQAQTVITESAKNGATAEKKERQMKAEQVTGKGRVVTDKEEIVAEYNQTPPAKKDDGSVDKTLVEGLDEGFLREINVLAGTAKESN